jgi:Tfp pilus assembly protein PilX
MANVLDCLSTYLTENCNNGYCNKPVTKKEMNEQINEERNQTYFYIYGDSYDICSDTGKSDWSSSHTDISKQIKNQK